MSLPVESGWRREAARIVEELFAVTPPQEWDSLLELRGALISGRDWSRALDLFLACRVRLESDHYLPFYRLRRLIAASLRLEAGQKNPVPRPLAEWLKGRHRSLADIQRRVQRDWFEHGGNAGEALCLRVVEA